MSRVRAAWVVNVCLPIWCTFHRREGLHYSLESNLYCGKKICCPDPENQTCTTSQSLQHDSSDVKTARLSCSSRSLSILELLSLQVSNSSICWAGHLQTSETGGQNLSLLPRQECQLQFLEIPAVILYQILSVWNRKSSQEWEDSMLLHLESRRKTEDLNLGKILPQQGLMKHLMRMSQDLLMDSFTLIADKNPEQNLFGKLHRILHQMLHVMWQSRILFYQRAKLNKKQLGALYPLEWSQIRWDSHNDLTLNRGWIS